MSKNSIPSWMIQKLSKKQENIENFYVRAMSAYKHVYNMSNNDDILYPLCTNIHKYIFAVDQVFKKKHIRPQYLDLRSLKYKYNPREKLDSDPEILINIDTLLCGSLYYFFAALNISLKCDADLQPKYIQDLRLEYEIPLAKIIYKLWEARLECCSCSIKDNCDIKKEKLKKLYEWRKELLNMPYYPFFVTELNDLNKKKKLI